MIDILKSSCHSTNQKNNSKELQGNLKFGITFQFFLPIILDFLFAWKVRFSTRTLAEEPQQISLIRNIRWDAPRWKSWYLKSLSYASGSIRSRSLSSSASIYNTSWLQRSKCGETNGLKMAEKGDLQRLFWNSLMITTYCQVMHIKKKN